MTLDTLKTVGQQARIVDVLGEDSIAVRLMEMGLTEDEQITVMGFAPLGDPVEYAVRGYRISLRLSEARRIVVSSAP